MYDRAVKGKFKELQVEEKHELFERIGMQGMFTYRQSNGKIVYKEERPVLLITSTSYTPDEDIGLLIEALEKYV